MNWVKGYLSSDTGRCIGKEDGESVHLNMANALLLIKDGDEPYIKHIEALSQYRFQPFDCSFLYEIMGVNPGKISTSEIDKLIASSTKQSPKKKSSK